MTVQIHHEICNYCGACVAVCPSGALELIDMYLRVNPERCRDTCRFCAKICPMGAFSERP